MRGRAARALIGVAAMAAVMIVTLVTPAPASAQDGVISLDETVIKGRIQKPEAFYILQHANLSYESLDVKPPFLEELVKTVEEEPF